MPSGLTSTSAGATGSIRMADASGLKAVAERPAKERDQSTTTAEALLPVGDAVGRGPGG